MLFLRVTMLMAVVGLFATGDEAQAKKKKEHTFHGRIVSVQQGKGKKHTTITVAHHRKAKKAKGQQVNAQAGQTVTKTFIISGRTQVNGGAAALQNGVRVAVRHNGHHADSITVLQGKGKGKGKKKIK